MNGKHLTAKKLNDNHLQDVMALQKKIIDNLHPDERHFILQRSAEEFQQHLNGKSSGMLGVFDGDRLVAQMVYGLPRNGEKRDMPEFRPDIANDRLVIYEAVLVDPEYRGSSLMKRMLECVEELAAMNGRSHSLIQIAIDNPASWINALHHGMLITRVDRDPVDGAKVLYLEKPVASADEQSFMPRFVPGKTYSLPLGDNIHASIPALFNKMQYLVQKGYHGIGLDKKTQSLVWRKRAKTKEYMSAIVMQSVKKQQDYVS